MDWSEIKGKWHQAAGLVKKRFGKLTHDDVTESQGNREILIGRLQARYGYSREVAEQELSRFVNEHWTGMTNPANAQTLDEHGPRVGQDIGHKTITKLPINDAAVSEVFSGRNEEPKKPKRA